MIRKIIALLLTIIMAVLMLAGCGNRKEESLSETLRFINATYAVITTRNGGNYELVGGFKANNRREVAKIQGALESSWSITDAEDARKTIDWLLSEGSNLNVLQEYEEYDMNKFSRSDMEELLTETNFTPELIIICKSIYDSVQKFGDNAILAWDLCRAEQLLGWFYLAGYYTYEEAMDQSLLIAKTLQESYSSWDEMMESYFLGYQYWSEESIEDTASEAYTRFKLYEQLKAMENGSYTVQWNTQLQKEW